MYPPTPKILKFVPKVLVLDTELAPSTFIGVIGFLYSPDINCKY